jgi:hypothetical protein
MVDTSVKRKTLAEGSRGKWRFAEESRALFFSAFLYSLVFSPRVFF